MKKSHSLIFSISFHLILVIIFLFIDIKRDIEVEEESIKINLIKRSDARRGSKRGILNSDIDVVSGKTSRSISKIETPKRTEYLKELNVEESGNIHINDSIKHKRTDISKREDFEKSLSDIVINSTVLEAEESSDRYSISWQGDERISTSNISIDFKSFPIDSFTGVGVKASFHVNPKGEVYGVEIAPPGSGSAEFDILIKKYVSNFTFSSSDVDSRGEVFIVYKK